MNSRANRASRASKARTKKKSVIVEVHNVGVCSRQRTGVLRYQRFWGLEDVSFEIRAGETLGIIGANGAGKSTLLRLLARVTEPDRGRIVWRRNMTSSLLALNVGFRPELSGRNNAIISGLLLGLKLKETTGLLDKIRDFSELGDFFDQPAGTYSTGMRARLGFAVAIHADRDLLLIDEVLGVGDESFRLKSQQAMREKIRGDKTVVLVSHSMEAIRELCDRVIWIDKGRSVGSGDANQVIEAYSGAVREAVKQLILEAHRKNAAAGGAALK